jgi:hypothetical protein
VFRFSKSLSKSSSKSSSKSLRRTSAAVCCVAALLLADGAFANARAQGKLDARYTATLSGIPLGKGAWVIDITDNEYIAAASGMTTGLIRVFTGGQGSGAARGGIVSGNFAPASYSASISTDKRTEEIRITLGGGNVKESSITPESPVSPKAIPVTDSHRRNVIDPMTASLVRAPGKDDPLNPESCKRHMAIFDGRIRYDLDFAYKRMEKVKADKGYAGPALVCSVFFSPVAGHVPDRAAVKYLTELRDMEVWLVPVAGTRVLVPFRFSLPTPMGPGVLEATQFITTPLPSKASVKTQ